jgi:hypothetical protein
MLPYLLECKTTFHVSWLLLQLSVFRKISVQNMFNSVHNCKNWIEWIKKDGHCSDLCTLTFISLLCGPVLMLLPPPLIEPSAVSCWWRCPQSHLVSPRCLNHNVAIASQIQSMCETVSDACFYLSHPRLFTSPSLINVVLSDTVMLITPSLFIAGFCLSWVIIIGSCSFSAYSTTKCP